MKKSELFFTALLVPVDAAIIVMAFISAYYLRQSTGVVVSYWELSRYLVFIFSLLPFWLIIFASVGLYGLKQRDSFLKSFGKIFAGVAGGTGVMMAWPLVTQQEFFSRLVVVYVFLFALIFMIVGRGVIRLLQRALYRVGIGVNWVVLAGTNKLSVDLMKIFQSKKYFGKKVFGVLTEDGNYPAEIPGDLRLGLIKDFRNIFKDKCIDEIIITDINTNHLLIGDIFDYALSTGATVKIAPNLFDFFVPTIELTEISGRTLMEMKRTPLDGWGKIVKRSFDIFGSTILIILTSPIMLITALLIKLDSRGPVFFSRLDDGSHAKRVGQFGKLFNYFKFRSMYPNTHNQRYTDLSKQNTRQGPLVKIADDPRITRVGKIIRKFSIDELPEFFLVFIGRMSLVGPRPHLPEEVNKYLAHHRRVLTIKPGITGMAQISGRSDLSFEDEVHLDTYYIEKWSFLQDLIILFKTPGAVLASRNRKAS